jgi:hypothetical protein
MVSRSLGGSARSEVRMAAHIQVKTERIISLEEARVMGCFRAASMGIVGEYGG